MRKHNESSEYNKYGTKIAFEKKKKTAVILQTERFDNIDSAVVISSVNFQLCTALLTLLMMTAESMLLKRPVNCCGFIVSS